VKNTTLGSRTSCLRDVALLRDSVVLNRFQIIPLQRPVHVPNPSMNSMPDDDLNFTLKGGGGGFCSLDRELRLVLACESQDRPEPAIWIRARGIPICRLL
jgi:hypothetical protein